MSLGRLIEQHSVYELRNPEEAEIERRYENHREATYRHAHGSLDGYESRREFPCTGFLREIDCDEHGISTVACDACPYSTTARLARRDERAF